ncbi:TolC family protein [Salibacter halophilus]|uniref:TolC family protein n=1 Tax=Salibacter halophilus TaxID=1803916 RepID=A0A6N6M840_9FLAO|nr:TolC family protein [Salibacter halophilus]KAB1064810.1 TolC family protein [Salibacter halophilus]
MYKTFVVLLALVVGIYNLQAQQSSIEEILQTIESNNNELAAFRSYIEGESWKLKAQNKLPDPQASAFYLPFGVHNSEDYSEFQISQQFEFPTVYAARGNWIDKKKEGLEQEYQKLKQDILLDAEKLILEFIFLQKKYRLVEQRVDQSKEMYGEVGDLFEKEQVDILDKNKARIVWLDQQFALEELETQQMNIVQDIKALNGGNEINPELSVYPYGIEIPSEDSIWNEYLNQDAQIELLEQETQVAQQRLKVERNQLLPNITAGYNYQGVAGNNYSGFYGGISIPLWSGHSKVKVAKAQIDYQEQHKTDVITSLKSKFSSRVQRYQLLLKKYREYQLAMDELNGKLLIQKSYELGEISFSEYFSEVAFYHQAEDRMLEIEKELQQLRAELFKYKL